MPTTAYSIEVNARPERVFAFLDDFDNDRLWRANVVEMVPRGNASDPFGVWSRQVERRRVPGRIIETEAIITERSPPRRLVVQRASGPVRPMAIYEIAATPTGARIDFGVQVDLAGQTRLLKPLVALLLAIVVKPALPGDFARLKSLLEQPA